MRPNIFTTLLALATPLALAAAEPQVGSGETDGYVLVWQDLFDAGQLNPERWNIEVNGNGGGNNELQYYTDFERNVRVGDDGKGNGCLILTAIREEYNNRHFTSGRVNSLGKVRFKHGKLEAAIKLPSTANGLWPAFWAMGDDFSEVGWPKCGETDIMEFGHADGIRNGTQDRYFNGASHWGTRWDRTGDYARSCTKNYSLQDGEFHLWTMTWDENRICMYVDLDKYPVQTPYYQIDITEVNPDNDMTAGNYFHKENFIIFNLAIGGNFPAIWDAAGITALNPENGQQAAMYINYVKVYQKGDASESLNVNVPGDPQDSSAVKITEAPVDVTVSGNVYSSADADMSVFDLAGQRVASGRGSVDTSSLCAGVYVLRVDQAGKSRSIKIVR